MEENNYLSSDTKQRMEEVKARYVKLQDLLTYPEIVADIKYYHRLSRELDSIKCLVEQYDELMNCQKEIQEYKEILNVSDEKMANDLKLELSNLDLKSKKIAISIKNLLVKSNLANGFGVRLEIYSCDNLNVTQINKIFNMYLNFVEFNKYEEEIIRKDNNAIVKIIGLDVYSKLQYENGLHEIVINNKSCNIKVVVLPLDDVSEYKIRKEDIRIDYYHSSGAGGQNINKVETAIRLTHIPTGIVVACQDERSQKQNKEKAYRLLIEKIAIENESKLFNKMNSDRKRILNNAKKAVRIYNFDEEFVQDMRIANNKFNLTSVLSNGFNDLLEEIIVSKGRNAIN